MRLYWRARGYDHHAQHGSCAPYIGALLTSVPASVFSFFSLHETLPVFAFAPLHLCAFAPLFCSTLSASLVSALLSSLICSRLCSALLSAVVFSLSALHSPLLLGSASVSALGSSSLVAIYSQNWDSLAGLKHYHFDSSVNKSENCIFNRLLMLAPPLYVKRLQISHKSVNSAVEQLSTLSLIPADPAWLEQHSTKCLFQPVDSAIPLGTIGVADNSGGRSSQPPVVRCIASARLETILLRDDYSNRPQDLAFHASERTLHRNARLGTRGASLSCRTRQTCCTRRYSF